MNRPISLIAVDVGEVSTRAYMLGSVKGEYRLLAFTVSPTTGADPFFDVRKGVFSAIQQISSLTGCKLIDENGYPIIPRSQNGTGFDALTISISAGPPMKAVLIGLTEEISIRSLQRLARSSYIKVMDTLSLHDRRSLQDQVNAIIRIKPDIVIIAGGFDKGASNAIFRVTEPLKMACALLPQDSRPEILYTGNKDLQNGLRMEFYGSVNVTTTVNIHPQLDFELYRPASIALRKMLIDMKSRHLQGLRELMKITSTDVLSGADSFGRVIKFLSRSQQSDKYILGVDIGGSATTIACAHNGDLILEVYPEFGLGDGFLENQKLISLEKVIQWIHFEIDREYVNDYLWNKSLFPSSIPATLEDLAIEQALTRCFLQACVNEFINNNPILRMNGVDGVPPTFEPIIASGSALTGPPNLGQTILMLIDGLQPKGATTIVLDLHHIFPALGTAAEIDPLIVVQALKSNLLAFLGTVISVQAKVLLGHPVLKLRMVYGDGKEALFEVNQGDLMAIPLEEGREARLVLHPLRMADIGMGAPGRGGGLQVVGGFFGVIIDARGRPLKLPRDRIKRQELMANWSRTMDSV